MINNQCTCN